MTCTTCSDTGIIFRPKRTITTDIQCHEYIDGELDTYTKTVSQTVGGIDACPRCTILAELDYMSHQMETAA